jgi:acetamidase/formamidase
VIHELPLERRTLHGHFSPDLEPVLTVDPGDSVSFSVPDAAWSVVPVPLDDRGNPVRGERETVVDVDPVLDEGHALVGPIAVRGARAGGTLAVRIDEVRVGPYGWGGAGGWSAPLNDRLGVSDGDHVMLAWEIDDDRRTARDHRGREVTLRPFLGVIGMPPPEPGVHSTAPPRRWGGNLDCAELVPGSTLFLPIPVEGGLLSLGDAHGRQADGELSTIALECPVERGRVTLDLHEGPELTNPLARVDGAWITFGVDEDLDEAAAQAVDGMLDLMRREHGIERREALALASLVVDLRVTQVVNGVRGAHAVLRDDAIRFP